MSPAFSARRRAEQFDALLEGTLTEAPSAELARLVAVAEQVRAVPEVGPRPEFAAGLRERLMAEAPAALAAAEAATASEGDDRSRLTVGRRTPSTRSHERRIGVAIAAFSLVGATAASAVASQGSLPGDTLYPVKRLIEDARTSLVMGEDAKADVLLSQARTRLDEARRLTERDEPDAGAIRQALRDFGDAADEAATAVLADYADHGDAERVDALRTFAQRSVTTLSELVDATPVSVHDTLADVTKALLAIDHSAAEACPACDAAGITELPSTLVDLLGVTAPDDTASTITQPSATTQKPERKPEPRKPAPAPSQGPTAQPPDTSTGEAGQPAPGSTNAPNSGPTSLGGVVGGAGDALGGTVGGVGGAVGDLGDQVGGPVGGVLGGVGGTVGGVGGTLGGVTGGVGDTVDGLLGGLLGTPTPSPTPKP